MPEEELEQETTPVGNFPLPFPSDVESIKEPTASVNISNELSATFKKNKEHDAKIDNETYFNFKNESLTGSDDNEFIGEKWKAYSESWNNTWLATIIDDYKYNERWDDVEDKQFTHQWTDESVVATLEANKLDLSYYQRIAKAQNQKHLNQLITWSKEEKKRNNFINETLNEYSGTLGLSEAGVASVTTSFLDIDAPIALTTGGLSKLGGTFLSTGRADKMRKVMAASAAGAHGVAGAYVYDAKDGSESVGQVSLFTLLGGTIDSAVAYRIGKSPLESAMDIPSDKSLVDDWWKENNIYNADGKLKYKQSVDDTIPTKELDELEDVTDTATVAFDRRVNEIENSNLSETAKNKALGQATEQYIKDLDEVVVPVKDVETIPQTVDDSIVPFNAVAMANRAIEVVKEKVPYVWSGTCLKSGADCSGFTQSLLAEQGIKIPRTAASQALSKKGLVVQKSDAQVGDIIYFKPTSKKAKARGLPVTHTAIVTGIDDAGNIIITHAKSTKSGMVTEAMSPNRAKSIYNIKRWSKKADGTSADAMTGKERVRFNKRQEDSVTKRKQDIDDDATLTKKEKTAAHKRADADLERITASRKTAQKLADDERFNTLQKKRIDKDYKAMAEDFVTNAKDYKAMIKKALAEGDTKTIDDLNNIVDDLKKDGYINQQQFDTYKAKLADGKFEPPKLKATQNKDGSFSVEKEVPAKKTEGETGGGKTRRVGARKKKVLLAGVLGLALTESAMAGDGSDTGFLDLLAGVALLGVGYMGVKNFGSMKRGAGNLLNDISTKNRTQGARAALDETISKLQTSLTETLSPLSKDKNVDFRKFLKKVLWDFENGDNLTIERNASSIYHGLSGILHKASDMAYREWLKEIGMSRFKAASSNLVFDEMSQRAKFEVMIFENIEQGKHMNSPAVVKAGKDVKVVIDDLKKQMKASGVKGADTMFDSANYMPRYFRGNEMNVLFRSLDVFNQDKFIKAFSKMFVGKSGDMAEAEKKAREYFKSMIDIGETRQRFTNIKEIEDYIKVNNLTHITADEMADALGISTAQSGRTKARIRIDKSKFQPIEVVDVDGNKEIIDLNRIFVNNSIEAVDRLLKTQSGHIAFADAGFTSLDKAYELAKQGSPKNAKVMTDVIDLIVGKQIMDVGADAAKALETASNLATAIKMPLSVLSLTQEVFNTIVKSKGAIWGEMAKEAVNIFRKHGESSALVNELVEFMGQGNHKYTGSYGAFGHIGNAVENSGEAVGGAINKLSQIGRDTVLYNLGLVPVSDFLTRINLVDSASFLHDVAFGTKNIDARLRQTIGLTKEIEDMLKTKLVKKDGTLQAMDIKNWDRADQLAFRKVVDNMMQKRIQMSTYGGTPAWSRSNTAGVVVSQLMKFPLQAFSNHGIYDLKGVVVHHDPRAMAAMTAWFTGGYVASMLRSEIKGQDRTTDEHLTNAMLSMPIGGVTSLYGSLTDKTAIQGTLGSISDNMKMVADVIAK